MSIREAQFQREILYLLILRMSQHVPGGAFPPAPFGAERRPAFVLKRLQARAAEAFGILPRILNHLR
jgi:hypothetical protein